MAKATGENVNAILARMRAAKLNLRERLRDIYELIGDF
jgi:hypothetical protein